jgi:hypothetical protein
LGLALIFGISIVALNRPPPKTDQPTTTQPGATPAPQPQRPASVESPAPSGAAVAKDVASSPAKVIAEKPHVPAPEPKTLAPERRYAPQLPKQEMTARETSVLLANQAAAPTASAMGGAAAVKKPQVLDRFEMQQNGTQLRFVDADQSTYSGTLFASATATNAFRAAGTNRTLQQSVIFTGQVVRTRAAPARQNQPQVRLATEQVRVQGQAQVGGTNQIKIDAQSGTAE